MQRPSNLGQSCFVRLFLLSFSNKKCSPTDFDKTSSASGWTFYPARMLPEFSINIAGKNQSVMLYDAATCASDVMHADVSFPLARVALYAT
jgi:hypothetical protein